MAVLGIDLGGTQSKLGVVENGIVTHEYVCDTPVQAGYEAVTDTLADGARFLIKSSNAVTHVGLASPGLVDGGIVRYSNNFDWYDKPLQADLQQAISLPVNMANDAQCAALGEALYGAGQGFSRVAMLTIGTGVGGGFVCDGKIDTEGYGSLSSIFGHMTVEHNGRQCNCGRRGCLECYSSATAVAAAGSRMLGKAMSAHEIFAAARDGDKIAIEIVSQAADYLADGAVNLANILRPQVIIIGGGVSASCDLLLPAINKALTEQVYGTRYAPVNAVSARLGNRAGVIGAACLWQNDKNNGSLT